MLLRRAAALGVSFRNEDAAMLRLLLRRAAALGVSFGAGASFCASSPARAPLTPIKCEDGTTVLPWDPPTREAQLARLEGEEFDLVVIGGGCVGAGVAWEASTRGLKVALVEADDFSAGTSGRSTKLIHGGIRYLEAAFKNLDKSQYDLVVEALEERAHLLNAAPYMAHPLPTLIPIYTWWEVPYVWLGTKVYDLLAGSRRFVPASHYISADEAMFLFPMLRPEKLKGGIVYYDGLHNDTRMNLMIALTAAQGGAAIANYVGVTGVLKDAGGRARGVAVRDGLTGRAFSVRARGVVNATGCFGDAVRKMDRPDAPPLIQGAAGVHIILPDHFSPASMGLIVPKTRDGRVLFFLPWEGSTICGTTDAPCDITMEPRPFEEDVAFILEEANRFLSRPVRRSDVRAAWSGIRPLIVDPYKAAAQKPGERVPSSALARTHVVEVSPSGMVSVLGGKWTTYRRMAEDAVDAAAAAVPGLPALSPSVTQRLQVLGADRAGVVLNRKYHRIPITLRETYGLEKEVAAHLAANYGTRSLQVAELARSGELARWGGPALSARISPRFPFIFAEVVFAVQHEYAVHAVDVLARRTRLAFLNAAEARAAVPAVVELMGRLLGWSAARRGEEEAAVARFLDTMTATPAPAAPVP
jgi:glycerol-3-phosphate dehydrogenase